MQQLILTQLLLTTQFSSPLNRQAPTKMVEPADLATQVTTIFSGKTVVKPLEEVALRAYSLSKNKQYEEVKHMQQKQQDQQPSHQHNHMPSMKNKHK